MSKYAIVDNGVVINIVKADKKLNDNFVGLGGQRVRIGDTFNGESFTESEVVSNGIRTVTKRSFMQRFDQSERIAIRKSTDDIVIDIHEDLKMASNVDLDHPDTVSAVAYLGSAGLLTVSTVSDLLKDGAEDERY